MLAATPPEEAIITAPGHQAAGSSAALPKIDNQVQVARRVAEHREHRRHLGPVLRCVVEDLGQDLPEGLSVRVAAQGMVANGLRERRIVQRGEALAPGGLLDCPALTQSVKVGDLGGLEHGGAGEALPALAPERLGAKHMDEGGAEGGVPGERRKLQLARLKGCRRR